MNNEADNFFFAVGVIILICIFLPYPINLVVGSVLLTLLLVG